MAGAEAGARVAVEKLVEKDQVSPVRILLERLDLAVDGASAVLAAQEDAREPSGQVGRDALERHHPSGSGRALHSEIIAEVVMELLQRLDE